MAAGPGLSERPAAPPPPLRRVGHRVVVFGVNYSWRRTSKRGAAVVRRDLHPIYRALWEHARPYLSRQKRDVLTYWDGLTFLQGPGARTLRAGAERETLLCLRALVQLADQRPDPDTVIELTLLPELERFRPRLVYHRADGVDPEAPALARTHPAARELTKNGTWRAKRGFHKEFLADGQALVGPLSEANWPRLFVLAILAHLRSDLEVYYETGFFRIRRCERRACLAWFAATAMGSGKQRFCSNGCRASNIREST